MVRTKQCAKSREMTGKGTTKLVESKGESNAAVKKTDRAKGGIKRKRPLGEKALMEIRNLQRSSELLINKASFARLVREVALKVWEELGHEGPMRMQVNAILTLQEASEAHVTSLMEDGNMIAMHAKRSTLMAKDVKMACQLRGYPSTS